MLKRKREREGTTAAAVPRKCHARTCHRSPVLTINVPFGSSATLPCSCHLFSRYSFLKHFLEAFTKYHKSLFNTSVSKSSHFWSSWRTDSIFGPVPLLHNEHIEKNIDRRKFHFVCIGELLQCCSEVKGDSNANRKTPYFPTCHWHLHFPSFKTVFTSHVLTSCLFAYTIVLATTGL